ncbi:MAG: cytidine deaminase [Cyanobacteria bacterium]|nr:cytidine deaminase [Cyanobacteriota bacterium]
MIINAAPDITPQTLTSFYRPLLDQASEFSHPPVSNYKVGAVVIGNSGKAYLGSNFEVKRGAYGDTIHAEQFAVTLAKLAGETGIKAIVVSAEPCGHCRQFMMETGVCQLPIYFQDSQNKAGPGQPPLWKETSLGRLLPSPFTLAGERVNLYTHRPIVRQRVGGGPLSRAKKILVDRALEAAAQSYHPITKDTWAGLAIETLNGEFATGFPIESAAFNPTMPPLQVALVDLISKGFRPNQIRRAVLIEPVSPDLSFKDSTLNTLKKLAPRAQFSCIKGR